MSTRGTCHFPGCKRLPPPRVGHHFCRWHWQRVDRSSQRAIINTCARDGAVVVPGNALASAIEIAVKSIRARIDSSIGKAPPKRRAS